MSGDVLPKQSAEYIETLSDVFANLVNKGGWKNIESSDVTASLAECMEFILLHGASSISRIAEGMSISLPAASQLVERLTKKGLAVRNQNSSDRRLAKVDLTEAGRDIITKARMARLSWIQKVTSRMSDEQKEALIESLERFIRASLENDGAFEEACARCGIEHLAYCVVAQTIKDVTGESLKNF